MIQRLWRKLCARLRGTSSVRRPGNFPGEETEPDSAFATEHSPTVAEVARVNRAVSRLTAAGISQNSWLPMFASAADINERSGDQITERVMALYAQFMRAQAAIDSIPIADYRALMAKNFGTRHYAAMSSYERAFVDNPDPARAQVTQAIWMIEAIVPLLWANRRLQSLAWPNAFANPSIVMGSLQELMTGAASPPVTAMRHVDEVLDEAELNYRLAWACREKALSNKADTKDLVHGVVMERHRAFAWLIEPDHSCSWHEIDCST
ncbi:hypothetical protein BH11PLA1_BH11PLA1_12480 [soil metagenome]